MSKPITGTAILKNIEAMERLAGVIDKFSMWVDRDPDCYNQIELSWARCTEMLDTITERTHNAVMQEFEL